MNRLRKDPPPAISRTLAIATGAGRDGSHSHAKTTQRDVQPRTSVEQYWAARALKAETTLSARDTHQLEVNTSGTLKKPRDLCVSATDSFP
jgi:hypothetical protein